VKEQSHVLFVRVAIEVIDLLAVKPGGPEDDAVYLVALSQQELGQRLLRLRHTTASVAQVEVMKSPQVTQSSERRCLVCRARQQRVVVSGTGFNECTACGYAVLDEQAMSDDYWADSGDDSSEVWRGIHWRDIQGEYFLSVLKHFEATTEGRRLLDIGGGPGFFAEMALRRAWDAFSFDISQRASAMAARRIGKDRVIESIDENLAASFDVVSLWCVVAHVTDPVHLIRQAVGALRQNGLLWITTPNFRFQKGYGFLRALVGKPIDFRAEGHIGHFTSIAIRTLLRGAGLPNANFQYCGAKEVCSLTGSGSPMLVALKRLWNRTSFELSHLGMPNYMSELQVAASR
jgi:2-polyprenyl-3-methyl-5-hydroxy-6-metoxy-1,4-benzoquinol methylase